MHFSKILSALLSIPLVFAIPTPIEERQACSTGITAARKTEVQNAFTSSGVVPTLIPSINPQVDVSVAYGAKQVNLGNQFLTAGMVTPGKVVRGLDADLSTSVETLTAPSLSFTAESGRDAQTTTYSYFLVDPDVPQSEGAPVVGLRVNFLHWYVSGAKSRCATSQNPRTVTLYQALTPASTTQHRYTFLVYREPPNYVPDVIGAQVRVGFNVNDYAAKAGLVLVGGNFLREAITNGVLPS